MEKEFIYSSINQLIRSGLGGDLICSFNENNNLLNKGDISFCLEEGENMVVSYQENEGEPVDCLYDEQGRIVTIKNKPVNLHLNYDFISVLPIQINRGTDAVSSCYGVGGQRVMRTEKRSSGAVQNYFLFEESSLFPFMDLDSQGSERIYIRQQENLLAVDEGEVHYLLSDDYQSTRVIIDKEGKRVAQWSYSPYGELSQNVDNNNFTTPYLYNGQYYEDLFQLYQFPYRVYSPTMGLFLLQDPLDQHYSPYVYCDANPIRFQDVDGRMDEEPPPRLAMYGADMASTVVGPVDDSYNCHAYAWTDEKGFALNGLHLGKVFKKWGGLKKEYSRGFLKTPIKAMVGNQYVALDFYEPNRVGDRIVYFKMNDANRSRNTVLLEHSGIVTGVDEKGNAIEITSKWGKSSLRTHHPRQVPPRYADDPRYTGFDGLVLFDNKFVHAPYRRYYRQANLLTDDVRPVSDPIVNRSLGSVLPEEENNPLEFRMTDFHVASSLPVDSLLVRI